MFACCAKQPDLHNVDEEKKKEFKGDDNDIVQKLQVENFASESENLIYILVSKWYDFLTWVHTPWND